MGRYTFLIALMLLLAVWIAYNTFRNAVVDAGHWNKLAQRELSSSSRIIQPERGDILAADGSVLASTLQSYALRVDFGSEGFDWKGYVENKDALADSLHKYFPIKGGVKAWQDSLDVVLVTGKRPRGWRLIDNVNYADYLQIKSFPFFKGRRPGKCGLLPEPKPRRRNPYGDMARLSIGIVSEDSTRTQHGYSGLECALDKYLYGTPGISRQVNYTRGIGQWEEKAPVRGWDVHTTIDVRLQDMLETALINKLKESRADWGTAILMEVKTGEIKAISNFDQDKKHPGEYIEAMNYAVRGFEPGSVVKTLSLMIAIEDGYVTDLDTILRFNKDKPYYPFKGVKIKNSHRDTAISIRRAMAMSSNVGITKMMAPHFSDPYVYKARVDDLGIMGPLNSGIWEEKGATFTVPSHAKMANLANQFYGYGCMIPPLHTLSIYNAIANGGKFVYPHLVRSFSRNGRDSFPEPRPDKRLCSEKTSRMVRDCLEEVVKTGTAKNLSNDYVQIAGKTGTAYWVDTLTHTYNHNVYRYAFCGYFPAENPKYSCMVLIFNPRAPDFKGATALSGAVLKDVALGMYARGMLGNMPDIKREAKEGELKAPVVYAGTSDAFRRITGVTPRTPATAPSINGVPDVRGMGLSDALTELESKGYAVTFSGVGLVGNQKLTGADGKVVHLELKE